MTFQQKLDAIVARNNTLVCVGLDSDWEKLPRVVKKEEYPQFTFNKAIIDATHDLVCAYKPNSAFYEARGADGVKELKMTCDYLREKYREIPIIFDAKRADIGSTNEGYVRFAFDYLGADAITLHPYLGREALQPFLDRKDKGCFILCRTSNPGAGELQDLSVAPPVGGAEQSVKLYQVIAQRVASEWNTNENCGLVVGATYPTELEIVRRIVGDTMPFLVPGIGTQGGDLENTLKNGLNSQKKGLIINSSRGIIFASSRADFAEKARKEALQLKEHIHRYRNN